MTLHDVELDTVCKDYLEYTAPVGRKAEGTVRGRAVHAAAGQCGDA